MVSNKIKIIRAVTVAQSVDFYAPMVDGMREHGYEIVSVSSPGQELEQLKSKGVRCIEIPMARHIAIARDIKSLYALIKIFRKEKPFIVHSMTPKAGMLCMLASWICRVPRRVHTFTGLVWPTATGIIRRILMATDWLTCTCATHVIPEGQGVMDDLQHHITHKKMKVLGYGNVMGVDMTAFSRRPEIMTKAEKLRRDDLFTFIFVGRIVGDKGINELIQAFIRMQTEKPNVRLLLVGNYEANLDPIKPETKELIDSNSSIEAVGPQYGDDLKAYYAASDCLVFPSYREGFPNTVMEAGAMDLPSIVTNINGSREIIINGENGVIIPSKDADALYTAMYNMATNTTETKRMAASTRQLIANRFEQSFVRQCLYDFYQEISK
jgi:glycosyltransferase involved in cell wall biosynthesis